MNTLSSILKIGHKELLSARTLAKFLLLGLFFFGINNLFAQGSQSSYPDCGSSGSDCPSSQISGPGINGTAPPCPGSIQTYTFNVPSCNPDTRDGGSDVTNLVVTGGTIVRNLYPNNGNIGERYADIQIGCGTTMTITACAGCYTGSYPPTVWNSVRRCATVNISQAFTAAAFANLPIGTITATLDNHGYAPNPILCSFTGTYHFHVDVNPAYGCPPKTFEWLFPSSWIPATDPIHASSNIDVTPSCPFDGDVTVFGIDTCGQFSAGATLHFSNPVPTLGPISFLDYPLNCCSLGPAHFSVPRLSHCDGTYHWFLTDGTGGTFTLTASENTATVTPSNGTCYCTVNCIATDGCGRTTNVASYPLSRYKGYLTVDWANDELPCMTPGCSFGIEADLLSANACHDANDISFTFSITGGNWTISTTASNIVTIVAGTSSTAILHCVAHTPCGDVTADDHLTANSGCSCKTGEPLLHPVKSTLSQSKFENGLIIKPNPADKEIQIFLPDPQGVVEMDLVSASGAVVKTIDPLGNNITINVSDLSSGTYYLAIRTSDYQIVRTINIAR